MPTMFPCLSFDGNAEEAMHFYLSVFENSKIGRVLRAGEAGPGPKGTFIAADFTLNGNTLMVLNGPKEPFTKAVSISVNCETQEEIDTYWSKLTADGGKGIACGWLEDKYGLAWQIAPTVCYPMLTDPDRAKADRAMQAMGGMVKLDIAKLQAAFDGE